MLVIRSQEALSQFCISQSAASVRRLIACCGDLPLGFCVGVSFAIVRLCGGCDLTGRARVGGVV